MLLNSEQIERLLAPVSEERPCGDDLEYDADFMALEVASRGREEQQFGNTIIPAEEPDWQSVVQLSMALFERSKDLRVVLVLLRGLAKTEGMTGFIAGLELLVALLNQYWPHLHPMLDIEDNNDSTMRMNALMPLSDPALLPRDLRGACLTATGIAATLTLRDLELAYDKATPREEEDVRPKGEVLAIIAEWASRFPDDFERSRTKYLGDVRATMKRIQQLPGILDNLLCENDPEFYMAERQRLATEIENLKWLLVQMDIKHNLDLQSIMSAVNYYNTCGEGKYATGVADREWNKLMKLLVRYGLQ